MIDQTFRRMLFQTGRKRLGLSAAHSDAMKRRWSGTVTTLWFRHCGWFFCLDDLCFYHSEDPSRHSSK